MLTKTRNTNIPISPQKVTSHQVLYIQILCPDTSDTPLYYTRMLGKLTTGEANHEAMPRDTAEKGAAPTDIAKKAAP